METLQEKLASAINQRESINHKEARQILAELQTEFPEDPHVNYGNSLPCAWMYDLLGLKKDSVPFQEKVVKTGLPDSHEFKVFLGMAYYNIGEHARHGIFVERTR